MFDTSFDSIFTLCPRASVAIKNQVLTPLLFKSNQCDWKCGFSRAKHDEDARLKLCFYVRFAR